MVCLYTRSCRSARITRRSLIDKDLLLHSSRVPPVSYIANFSLNYHVSYFSPFRLYTARCYMLQRLRLIARHTNSSSTKSILKATMATFQLSGFKLPGAAPPVHVHLTQDLSKDQLLSFPAFKTWISTLQHSLSLQKNKDHTFNSAPYKLRKIEIQSVDFFGGGRIGFIKLKAEVSNDNGEKLPGSVFLRGGSVGMMVTPSLFSRIFFLF